MDKLEPFVTVVKRNRQLVKLEFYQSVVRSSTTVLVVETKWVTISLLSPYKQHYRFLKLYARGITKVQCYADFY